MKNLRNVLVALIIALAVIIPLGVAATHTHPTQQTIVRIADNPTPTPQGSGCHGLGC